MRAAQDVKGDRRLLQAPLDARWNRDPAGAAGGGQAADQDMPPPPDEAAAQPAVKWIAPEKYSNPESSGLRATVSRDKTRFVFELKSR